jgi:lipopolysaccharide transport system permease protein
MDKEEDWSLIITPKRKLLDLQIRDLIRYRDLVFLFVKRDFVTLYKQTILGPIWFLVGPLISTFTYTFVFGRLAEMGTDGIPYTLFYFSGTMLWTFFTSCFGDASGIFLNYAGLFSKVYFPRLAVPVSNVFTMCIKTLIQFGVLMFFFVRHLLIGSPVHPSWSALAYPFLLIWLAAIGVGTGIIISSLTTKYRDLRNLVGFIVQLAMYATPVVYPLSAIPSQFHWVAYANPICAPIELFRLWFFGAGSPNSLMILSSLGITLVLLMGGLILFNQNERNFIDVI